MGMIQSKNVVAIIRKTLNLVDPRLIDHGERVAYMVYKMLQYEAKCSPQMMYEICLAALLHDIGAYKTEEIDHMVEFETKNVLEHSVYGYLFLSKFSFLDHVADVVLYHHLDYQKLPQINSPNQRFAMMVSLADRLDICETLDHLLAEERRSSIFTNERYSPEAKELFQSAQEEYHILEHIRDGSYMEELMKYISGHTFAQEEIQRCLRMLVYLIDFRSQTTVTHTIMTVGITMELARLLKLDIPQTRNIFYGALLHDLGKVSTPISILENPGRLTAEEMSIMMRHVSVTEEILDGFVDDEICQIAIRHHEKLDGSGYPHHLTADQLTRSQRAVAVADILSALSGRRSYKKEYSKDIVLSLLCKMRDEGKICGEIVELVVEHYDEIMQNVQKKNKRIVDTYESIKTEYTRLYEKCVCL